MIALRVDKKVEKGSPSFYRVKNSVRSDILIVNLYQSFKLRKSGILFFIWVGLMVKHIRNNLLGD